jgi:hypothetical protein
MEILIAGGGYIGMYTARRLERLLRPGEATVTVVDPRGYMTYQPFLAEAAAGAVEPRHVIAPLPRVLRHPADRLPGLARAPPLPSVVGAHGQPQGPGTHRLDPRPVLPARDRSAHFA